MSNKIKDSFSTSISMKDLKSRNVFRKDGSISVAIGDASNETIWVTLPKYFNESGIYTYSSATLIPIEEVEVILLEKDINDYKGLIN